MDLHNYSYDRLRTTVEPLIRKAGDILLSYFGKNNLRSNEKAGNNGSVTEADLHSEQFLIESLRTVFPETSFFAEESGISGDSDYCWVIDPLDGTTNFEHRIPYFCISIALTYKQVPQFAMVYQPLQDELFCAYRGAGALCNGVPISVSGKSVDRAIVVVGLPYEKTERCNCLFQLARRVVSEVYAVRHFGAVALDMAYLARGSVDGLFLIDLGWWDIAASMLLIEEAGGKVADFQGVYPGPDFDSVVSGTPLVYEWLTTTVKKAFSS